MKMFSFFACGGHKPSESRPKKVYNERAKTPEIVEQDTIYEAYVQYFNKNKNVSDDTLKKSIWRADYYLYFGREGRLEEPIAFNGFYQGPNFQCDMSWRNSV